jgi:hypothetical protein
MTICFHMNDCKLSHRKKKVMDSMIKHLFQEYDSIFEDELGAMTGSRGKTHQYLGMTLDDTVHGQIKISMFDYVDEIMAAFDNAEPKGGLFKVNKSCEKLKQDKAVEFHNLEPHSRTSLAALVE